MKRLSKVYNIVTCNNQELARTRQRTLTRSCPVAGNRRRVARRQQSIQMKVRKLQRLVPGGDGLGSDRLFMKTAGYIMFLKYKLNLLHALTKMYML